MPPFEVLYIAQYCAERWPEGGYALDYALGPVPEWAVKQLGYDKASATYMGWRPKVDAVKFFPNGILLLEAKVFKVLEALRNLIGYGLLVPTTEELRPWWNMPVSLRLVVPRQTDILQAQAKAYNIQLDIYTTPAVLEHAAKYEKYWTREYQLERKLRKQRLQELGLE